MYHTLLGSSLRPINNCGTNYILSKIQSPPLSRRLPSYKFPDVSEMLCSSDDGAVSTYETSVNFYETTGRNIQDGSNVHTRRRENLKSHTAYRVIRYI
jgi:hypothetical protein